MAYRQLQVCDQVRIKSKYVSHAGRNAVVIAVDDQDINLVRVQIVPWQGVDNQPTECVTLHTDHLMVRHEPNGFIIDGRIDHDFYPEIDVYEDERSIDVGGSDGVVVTKEIFESN